MQRMTWTEMLYGTKDATVDKQHQELFGLINGVLESFDKKETGPLLSNKLNKLAEFTKFHFSCEEGIMETKKCGSCDANKKAHHQFLTQFTELLGVYSKGGATEKFKEDFYKFVSNWLRSHIMVIDTRLREVS